MVNLAPVFHLLQPTDHTGWFQEGRRGSGGERSVNNSIHA